MPSMWLTSTMPARGSTEANRTPRSLRFAPLHDPGGRGIGEVCFGACLKGVGGAPCELEGRPPTPFNSFQLQFRP